MCLCVSRSVRTVCTAVTQAINFVTNPRADVPARYTVERAKVHLGASPGKVMKDTERQLPIHT